MAEECSSIAIRSIEHKTYRNFVFLPVQSRSKMAFKTSRKIECKRNARCCFNIRQRIRVCSFKEHRHTNFSTLKGRIQSPTSCSLRHLTLYIECWPSLLILIHDILENKRFSTTYNQLLHPHTSIYKAGKLSSLQSADINVCSLKLVGCLCSS